MVTYLAQNPVNQYPWKLVCFRAGSYCSQHIPMMSCHIEIITDFSCFICLFYLVLHALKHDSCCMFSSFISLLKSHPSFVEAMSHEKKSLSTKTHSYHPKMVGLLVTVDLSKNQAIELTHIAFSCHETKRIKTVSSHPKHQPCRAMYLSSSAIPKRPRSVT